MSVLRSLALVMLVIGLDAQDAPVASATPPAMVLDRSHVDLDALVTLHAQQIQLGEALSDLEFQLGYMDRQRILRVLPADHGCYEDLLTCDITQEPLHAALDQLCAHGHLRWRTQAGYVQIDRPLAPETLAHLISAAHPAVLPPAAADLAACAVAANALARCGDGDGFPALINALGDPALDAVPLAARPLAISYEQGVLDALGAATPVVSDPPTWDASFALEVLAPQPAVAPAIARAWARAGRGDMPYTPLLCYLCGAGQVTAALPVLRQLAVDPAPVVTDLDPHGQRQSMALGQIRAAAIWSLGSLHDRVSVAALTAMLKDPPPAALTTVVLHALGTIGDADAVPAILAMPPQSPPMQREWYLALARLQPQALSPPVVAAAGATDAMPSPWWSAIGIIPVAGMIPNAFAAHDLTGIKNAWTVLDAWEALARIPGQKPAVQAAARSQMTQATDPHLAQLDRLLLASLGDETLHAQLFQEVLSATAPAAGRQPWDAPLQVIAPLTGGEEDQLEAQLRPGRTDAVGVLADRRNAVVAFLAAHLPPGSDPSYGNVVRFLIMAQESTTMARLNAALTPPPTGDGATCLDALDELAQEHGIANCAVLGAKVVALLQDPRPTVAQRAALLLGNDWGNASYTVPLVAWESRQELADIPPAFVRAPDAPWTVPGPRRWPVRLPYADYATQAELMLHWALTSDDPGIKRTLIWWLEIDTEETQRPFRVEVVRGLMQLAASPDAVVANDARTQLTSFLALDPSKLEAALSVGLQGAWDDRATLKALDGLIVPVKAVLAPPDQKPDPKKTTSDF